MIIKESWDPDHTFPDLRLLIIEPSDLSRKSIRRVRQAGWGICRVPRLRYFGIIVQTLNVEERRLDMFGKLFIWNMTQYSAALWLDSDSIAVRSLHPIFTMANHIPGPGSAEPGPRVGASHNRPSYRNYLKRKHRTSVALGKPVPMKMNTGSFLIRPGNFNL